MADTGNEQGGEESALEFPQIDFDTDSYEAVRLAGAEAYRGFLEGLGYPDISNSLLPVPSDMNPYDRRVEDQRRKALDFLPRSAADLPLRTLARLGGHVTWGELEVFYNEPLVRGTKVPASQELRRWYAPYAQEFTTVFPEHSRRSLRQGLFGLDPDFTHFPDRLQGVASEVASALDRQPGRLLLFAVLLRDYAVELRPLARGFNFSIDALVREALQGSQLGGRASEALAYYDELIEREGLPPGPGAMLAALAIPGIPEINFGLPKNDLLPALRDQTDPRSQGSPASPPDILGHANSDQPTDRDRIGVAPLVEGLRALLDDERTGLGLSIGITAPWGAGKSSVMRQLQSALTQSRSDRKREWIPIRFDAWKYERSERLWAALSKAIYEEGLKTMPRRRERFAFKFRLERQRRGWFEFLVVPIVLLIAILVAGVLLITHVSEILGILAIAATVLGFGGFAAAVWGLVSDPFKRAIAGYVSDPAYEEQLGFTSEADDDIRHLTELLTEGKGKVLAIFVDDLDRCSPGHIVEAVEAINQIFNASERSNCVFILGMDRDLIAASIEVAYAETIPKLPPARRDYFGLHFLAKLVQLSVAVPAPDRDGIVRLLDALGDGRSLSLPPESPFYFPAQRRGPDGQVTHAEDPELERLMAEDPDLRVGDPAAAGPESALSDPRGGSNSDFGGETMVSESSPEFHAAERAAVAYLDPNPREVKRFDNAFRLQLLVAQKTPGCELDFGEDDLIAIGSWVAMRLRWPDLADQIDRDLELLGRLEAAANGDRPPEWDSKWLDNEELSALLREPNTGRRIARLQERTFLRIS